MTTFDFLMDEFCEKKDLRVFKHLSPSDITDLKKAIRHAIPSNGKTPKEVSLKKDKREAKHILEAFANPQHSHINTKKLNEKNFCNVILQSQPSEHDIVNLFYTFYNKVVWETNIPLDLKSFTNEDAMKIWHIYDNVYFNEKFDYFIKQKKSFIRFDTSKGPSWGAAATCGRDGCGYIINISNAIFRNPFVKKNYNRQKQSGVLMYCYTPLACMLNTLIHETVHLMMFVFCDHLSLENKIYKYHPQVFKNLLKNLDGSIDIYHYMGKEALSPRSPVNFKKGDRVIVKCKTGGDLPGIVVKINPKTVQVDVRYHGILYKYNVGRDSLTKLPLNI